MSANGAGCFSKGDTLMSVTVGVVSFGFLSMFAGLLIPTGILTIRALRAQWVLNKYKPTELCAFAIYSRHAWSNTATVFFFYRLQAQSTAYSTVISALSGVVLTAMFIACAAYVAAGISAILDLRFIAINKRRNFIITTVVRLLKK